MIIFFILICLIVGWAIFDNESGCLQVGLFCAAVIIVILLCFYFQRVYQSPEYEKKTTCNTPHSTIYKFSHSQYRCPNKLTHYCVEKSEAPGRDDSCMNCGAFFRLHQYEKTYQEEEADQIFMQVISEYPGE